MVELLAYIDKRTVSRVLGLEREPSVLAIVVHSLQCRLVFDNDRGDLAVIDNILFSYKNYISVENIDISKEICYNITVLGCAFIAYLKHLSSHRGPAGEGIF